MYKFNDLMFRYFGYSEATSVRLMYLLLFGTLLFGTAFTKLHLAGPLYLHDAFLILTIVACSFRFRLPPQSIPIYLILALSFLYLIFSVATRVGTEGVMLRQFATFLYLLCFYFLVGQVKDVNSSINFLIATGYCSICLQSFQVVKTIGSGLPMFDIYNYYSPSVVIGIIVFASYTFTRKNWSFATKSVLILLSVFLSTTTGHSSAFLSVVIVGLTFLFLRSDSKSKFVILFSGNFVVLLLWLFLPQFQDKNASWRLTIWNHLLTQAFFENHLMLGNGFGMPFFDDELSSKLFENYGSVGFFDLSKPLERFVTSGHSFLLTFTFYIGLIPSLLLLLPLIKGGIYAFKGVKVRSQEGDFLLLTLIGLFIWASFNMVVELPHSVGYFWLIYFTSSSVFDLTK
ncbi:MAG: hypothetical protein ACKO1F_04660 [Flammeovirgaceae bacterium]